VSEAQRFGRYRVTGTLGAGAMGEVHAAVDEVLGREVAVKTLRGHANGLAARMLDERFRQEARAIAALAHPGVVQVYDIDLAADPPYLVMERVAGPSLKERIERGGALGPGELRALGIQIGRALAAAHAQKIIHRDVKPANILAAGEGTWKLADFGVAHVPDSSLTMTGQFVGSPAYAPPEALVRGQCDVEGDVFGLGASLYHAAAGRWPRLEATTGGLLAPVTPIRSLVPDLPADIAEIIDRALAVEPTVRPTAGELADALAGGHVHASTPPTPRPSVPSAGPAAVATGPVATTPVTLPGSTTSPTASARWRPWAFGAGALLALGLVAGRCSSAPGDHAPGATPAPASLPQAAPRADERSPAPLEPLAPIRVETPPIHDDKAARDWNRILEHIERGNFSGAKRKLWEWERKHAGGPIPETEALRAQLEALGPDRDRGRDDDD